MLEGSVQRAGGKVRVNAQLIDARTDKHLWAKTYDRELADVFAIETEVAQAIANELQAKLSPGERALIEQIPTQNLAAYDLYVRAVPLVDGAAFSSTQDKDLLQAVGLLNQALALDPAFLLAYCWLARAHDSIYFLKPIDHTPARLALAKSAIDAAFRLQPDSEKHLLGLASLLGLLRLRSRPSRNCACRSHVAQQPARFRIAGPDGSSPGSLAAGRVQSERASEWIRGTKIA